MGSEINLEIKILQLTEQHIVTKFQSSLIY